MSEQDGLELQGNGHDAASEMVASTEQLQVGAAWRPYEQVRVRRVVRSGEVTRTVQVQWEEIEVDRVPLAPGEAVETATGAAPAPDEFEIVLMREEVVVEKRLVPYRRVRVRRGIAEEDTLIHERLRHEQLDVEQLPMSVARSPGEEVSLIGPRAGEFTAPPAMPLAGPLPPAAVTHVPSPPPDAELPAPIVEVPQPGEEGPSPPPWRPPERSRRR